MAKSFLRRISSVFTDRIKGFDMYPKVITFTYKGEDEFKTLFGGIISVIIKVILVLYTYMMVRIMLGRKDTSKSVNTVVHDILNDNDPISLKGTNFSFAFKVESDTDSSFYPIDEPNYFSILLQKYARNETTNSIDGKSVSFSLCNDRFNYRNQTEVQKLGINTNYYCPDTDDFTVIGNTFSPKY
ncbi:unnamed protein product [Moneuplotes crassus]|uniref:Uncharacterized protein n=1 Tax=Euplotes crassus TaxID=5936 RepID=A0AAD1Y621_EUPCR|nr:unnamed protein product [Moneuplotes crassus]